MLHVSQIHVVRLSHAVQIITCTSSTNVSIAVCNIVQTVILYVTCGTIITFISHVVQIVILYKYITFTWKT